MCRNVYALNLLEALTSADLRIAPLNDCSDNDLPYFFRMNDLRWKASLDLTHMCVEGIRLSSDFRSPLKTG